MKNRKNLLLTVATLLAAATLGACAENQYGSASADNTSTRSDWSMDGRWPNWTNNAPSDARSTTLGPGSYDTADGRPSVCDHDKSYRNDMR